MTPPMLIEVLPAPIEQATVLANLLELYIHDFSEFFDLKLRPDGRFGYEPLPLYWEDAKRFPFVIKADGDLAGFVFVQQGSQVSGNPAIWDVAEFFVARRFRRHGVGIHAAHRVWRMFSGTWEVRVAINNVAARAFWTVAVSEFIGAPATSAQTEVSGKSWEVFSFVS